MHSCEYWVEFPTTTLQPSRASGVQFQTVGIFRQEEVEQEYLACDIVTFVSTYRGLRIANPGSPKLPRGRWLRATVSR